MTHGCLWRAHACLQTRAEFGRSEPSDSRSLPPPPPIPQQTFLGHLLCLSPRVLQFLGAALLTHRRDWSHSPRRHSAATHLMLAPLSAGLHLTLPHRAARFIKCERREDSLPQPRCPPSRVRRTGGTAPQLSAELLFIRCYLQRILQVDPRWLAAQHPARALLCAEGPGWLLAA